MKVRVRQDGDYFSVLVNDKLYIDRESFSIAYGVAYYLQRPDYDNNSELAEVARQIRNVENRSA